MTIPLQFASLYDRWEIIWCNCLLDLGTDFLVGNMVTSIQEDGCEKGAHQAYLGAERNTLVNQNSFQPCQCCCCLCYPGEYLRLGTLISFNSARVLEACDCLKLLSIYFNLCADVTGIVCHQLGLLSSDLHAVGY